MVSAYNILKHVHRDECDGRVEVEGAGLHVTVSTCAGTAPQRPHQTLHHLYLPPSNMLTSHIFSSSDLSARQERKRVTLPSALHCIFMHLYTCILLMPTLTLDS